KRKTDIDPKTIVGARAFVAGLHDAGTGARNGHETVPGHFLREFERLLVVGIRFGRTRRAKDRDFAAIAIVFEITTAVTLFAQRARQDLYVSPVQLRMMGFNRRDN